MIARACLVARQNCDFSNAVLRGASDAGSPHFDYMIEADHTHQVYYFASMDGCSSGQKVAVTVTGHYTSNSAQCSNMGIGSSRIRHCDCDHHLCHDHVGEIVRRIFLHGRTWWWVG